MYIRSVVRWPRHIRSTQRTVSVLLNCEKTFVKPMVYACKCLRVCALQNARTMLMNLNESFSRALPRATTRFVCDYQGEWFRKFASGLGCLSGKQQIQTYRLCWAKTKTVGSTDVYLQLFVTNRFWCLSVTGKKRTRKPPSKRLLLASYLGWELDNENDAIEITATMVAATYWLSSHKVYLEK